MQEKSNIKPREKKWKLCAVHHLHELLKTPTESQSTGISHGSAVTPQYSAVQSEMMG